LCRGNYYFREAEDREALCAVRNQPVHQAHLSFRPRPSEEPITEWWNAGEPLIPVPKPHSRGILLGASRLLTMEAVDYGPHIYQWVVDNLPRRGVLFDVVANYGWISLNASHHVGWKGRVIAFEASAVLITLRRYHQRRNRLTQVTIVDRAVSDADHCTAEFYLLNGGLSSGNSLTIGRRDLPFLESEHRFQPGFRHCSRSPGPGAWYAGRVPMRHTEPPDTNPRLAPLFSINSDMETRKPSLRSGWRAF
jgi:hypothetical protein